MKADPCQDIDFSRATRELSSLFGFSHGALSERRRRFQAPVAARPQRLKAEVYLESIDTTEVDALTQRIPEH